MNQYRVTRRTSGVDWGTWKHTYHASLDLASAAVDRFFKGEGRYSSLASRHRALAPKSQVVVSKRREGVRYTLWEEVDALTYEQWKAKQPVQPTVHDFVALRTQKTVVVEPHVVVATDDRNWYVENLVYEQLDNGWMSYSHATGRLLLARKDEPAVRVPGSEDFSFNLKEVRS